MDFRGIIDHGVVRPLEPLTLPEGTEVECRPVNGLSADGSFWQSPSIRELAARQGVSGPPQPAALAGDWPPADSLDDFLADLRTARR
ncbi:MAG: antitoxin family protein [Pirellulales bacterium]|nr:antitoxin family protein [Pirellulales bacterium]